jgi:hypothetical protein
MDSAGKLVKEITLTPQTMGDPELKLMSQFYERYMIRCTFKYKQGVSNATSGALIGYTERNPQASLSSNLPERITHAKMHQDSKSVSLHEDQTWHVPPNPKPDGYFVENATGDIRLGVQGIFRILCELPNASLAANPGTLECYWTCRLWQRRMDNASNEHTSGYYLGTKNNMASPDICDGTTFNADASSTVDLFGYTAGVWTIDGSVSTVGMCYIAGSLDGAIFVIRSQDTATMTALNDSTVQLVHVAGEPPGQWWRTTHAHVTGLVTFTSEFADYTMQSDGKEIHFVSAARLTAGSQTGIIDGWGIRAYTTASTAITSKIHASPLDPAGFQKGDLEMKRINAIEQQLVQLKRQLAGGGRNKDLRVEIPQDELEVVDRKERVGFVGQHRSERKHSVSPSSQGVVRLFDQETPVKGGYRSGHVSYDDFEHVSDIEELSYKSKRRAGQQQGISVQQGSGDVDGGGGQRQGDSRHVKPPSIKGTS